MILDSPIALSRIKVVRRVCAAVFCSFQKLSTKRPTTDVFQYSKFIDIFLAYVSTIYLSTKLRKHLFCVRWWIIKLLRECVANSKTILSIYLDSTKLPRKSNHIESSKLYLLEGKLSVQILPCCLLYTQVGPK